MLDQHKTIIILDIQMNSKSSFHSVNRCSELMLSLKKISKQPYNVYNLKLWGKGNVEFRVLFQTKIELFCGVSNFPIVTNIEPLKRIRITSDYNPIYNNKNYKNHKNGNGNNNEETWKSVFLSGEIKQWLENIINNNFIFDLQSAKDKFEEIESKILEEIKQEFKEINLNPCDPNEIIESKADRYLYNHFSKRIFDLFKEQGFIVEPKIKIFLISKGVIMNFQWKLLKLV